MNANGQTNRCALANRLVGSLGAAVIALAVAGPAAAHARVVRTSPIDRSALARQPKQITITFDDEVQIAAGNQAVRNDGGSVLSGKPTLNDRTLTLPLRPGLARGDYSVRWSVISDEGHLEQGLLAFSIGSRPPPPSILIVHNGVSIVTVGLRWLFLVTLLLAGGVVLFSELVLRPATGAAVAPRMVGALTGTAAVSAFALFLRVGSGTHTRFGEVMAAATGLAAASAITTLLIRPRSQTVSRLAATPALVLLVVPTLAGHALERGDKPLNAAVDVLHVTAVAFWLGSLAALVVMARRPSQVRGAVVRRFSQFAIVTVAVIAVTGIGRAFAELDKTSQLWTTGYGKSLLVKSVLFAGTLAVAAGSRRSVQRSRLPFRSIGIEVAVLLGLMVAVGVLVSLPPGRAVATSIAAESKEPAKPVLGIAARPPADATVAAARDGALAAAIAVRPNGEAVATFIGSDGYATNVGKVRLDGNPTQPCGIGCYQGRTDGRPTVRVDHGRRTTTYHLGSRIPAAALLRTITARYEHLRTIRYSQRLASGLGTVSLSEWKEVAPASFAYRIAGGDQAIGIGTRRWDRTASGARWSLERTPISKALIPVWGTAAELTNVTLAKRTPDLLTLTFLADAHKPYPAWFSIDVQPGTLRLQTVRMTAAAHFMVAHYRDWNSTTTVIRQPRNAG